MISRCFGLLRLRFIAGGNGPRSLPSANLAYKTRAGKFWANYRASQLYWKGASIYDVRTERGGRGKKCTNFVDKQYIFCVLRGEGVKISQNPVDVIYGRPWTQKWQEWTTDDDDVLWQWTMMRRDDDALFAAVIFRGFPTRMRRISARFCWEKSVGKSRCVGWRGKTDNLFCQVDWQSYHILEQSKLIYERLREYFLARVYREFHTTS